MNNKENVPTEIKTELTHEMILMYTPDNEGKETLKLITATRNFLENHFKEKDEKGKRQKPLSYSQIRNILLEVKKHDQNLSRIIPTLAYMGAKLDETNQRAMVKFIRELLEKTINLGKETSFLSLWICLLHSTNIIQL